MTDHMGSTPTSTWWTVRCFCHSTLNLICLLFHPTPINKAQRSPSLSLCKARTWKKSDDSFKSRADKWTYMYFKIEILAQYISNVIIGSHRDDIKCHHMTIQSWYQLTLQYHTIRISNVLQYNKIMMLNVITDVQSWCTSKMSWKNHSHDIKCHYKIDQSAY